METINTFWPVVVAAFAGGCAVGALFFRAMSRSTRDARRLKAELEQKEQELKTYKSGVASHFKKTSELVNELTQDYVKVYQHLSEGARTLGEPRDDMNLLEQQPGRVLINVSEVAGEPEPAAAATDESTRDGQPATEPGEPEADEPRPVDDASREYISETLKEAAGIADKLDEKVEPAPEAAGSPSPKLSPKGKVG